MSYIRIHEGTGIDHKRISSTDDFFKNEYLKAKVEDDCIIFTVPTLDYNGRMYKTCVKNNTPDGLRMFTIVDERISLGKFEIDEEESTEDEIVVYFN